MNVETVKKQVEFAKKILLENPGRKLALATYTKEEFNELRPGEDYEDHKRQERLFIEILNKENINVANVVFVEIDSVSFYRFIGRRKLENNESTRALYAQYIAQGGKQ